MRKDLKKQDLVEQLLIPNSSVDFNYSKMNAKEPLVGRHSTDLSNLLLNYHMNCFNLNYIFIMNTFTMTLSNNH